MPAERYTDWTGIRVVGNRAAAAQYVPFARKLLGYVMQDAAHNSLGVNAMRRELADGTVVIAEKIGAIPRITIIPGPDGGAMRPVKLFSDFVIWPSGDAENDAVYPVIAQQHDEGWRSYFYKQSSAGYDEVAADARGTYKEVFPDAIPAGGFSWTWRNDRGECLNIYTGESYWVPKFRHPYTLYSYRVLHCGHVCLDLSKYKTAGGGSLQDISPDILGAAFRDGHLYVMCSFLSVLTYNAPPRAPVKPLEIWTSPQFSSTTTTYYLRRFKLRVITDPRSNVDHYEVIDGSDVLLWSGTIAGTAMYGPWHFNKDVTQVVTFGAPLQTFLAWRRFIHYETGPDEETSGLVGGSGIRFAVTIGAGDAISAAYTNAGDVIAEEDGITMRLVARGAGSYSYVVGATSYPAVAINGVAGRSLYMLEAADLVNGVLVFRERHYTVTSVDSNGVSTETETQFISVHRSGVQLYRAQIYTRSVYGHPAATQEVIDYIESLGLSGLSRFYLSTVLAVGAKTAADKSWSIAGPAPLDLMSQTRNPKLSTRYNLTGGWATGSIEQQAGAYTWQTDYRGYNGALDPWDGNTVLSKLVTSMLAANDERVICGIFPGIVDRAQYASLVDDDLSQLVGSLSPIAVGMLGKPPEEQPQEVPGP